jgi:hypothetical protein
MYLLKFRTVRPNLTAIETSLLYKSIHCAASIKMFVDRREKQHGEIATTPKLPDLKLHYQDISHI